VHVGAILFKTKNSDESENSKKQSMTEYYSRFTSEQFNVNETDDDDVYDIVPQSTDEGDDELNVFSIVGLELGKTGVIEPEVCAFDSLHGHCVRWRHNWHRTNLNHCDGVVG
jgi:NifB/MoaA-like Fe-S oxidoreductase